MEKELLARLTSWPLRREHRQIAMTNASVELRSKLDCILVPLGTLEETVNGIASTVHDMLRSEESQVGGREPNEAQTINQNVNDLAELLLLLL